MSDISDLSRVEWTKSSHSNTDGGNCVEFSLSFAATGVVPVRDSKVPVGPVVMFSADAWADFVTFVAE